MSAFQVKLRGFRIELGEIEAACRAAGARAAVCVLRKSRNGTQGLVAYYEPGLVRGACENPALLFFFRIWKNMSPRKWMHIFARSIRHVIVIF